MARGLRTKTIGRAGAQPTDEHRRFTVNGAWPEQLPRAARDDEQGGDNGVRRATRKVRSPRSDSEFPTRSQGSPSSGRGSRTRVVSAKTAPLGDRPLHARPPQHARRDGRPTCRCADTAVGTDRDRRQARFHIGVRDEDGPRVRGFKRLHASFAHDAYFAQMLLERSGDRERTFRHDATVVTMAGAGLVGDGPDSSDGRHRGLTVRGN